MTKIIFTVTAFFISLISLAQISETREVGNFSKLKASNAIEVFYNISPSRSLKVETDDQEKMLFIKTEVIGQTLKLYVDSNKPQKNSKKRKNNSWTNSVDFKVLKITILGPNLDEVTASSSSNIKIENVNKSDNLAIKVSSSGEIIGNFECNSSTIEASSSGNFSGEISSSTLNVDSSSSSTVSLEGTSKELICKSSSSSYCNLEGFKVENATVTASSSAKLIVKATNSVDAKSSSGGTIVYFGNPANVSKEKSSGGSIVQK